MGGQKLDSAAIDSHRELEDPGQKQAIADDDHSKAGQPGIGQPAHTESPSPEESAQCKAWHDN